MENIIYFGNDWFAENRTSSHHIAERLARNNRLLYIECPGLRSPKGSSRDLKKLISKLMRSVSGPREVRKNFYLYTLFQLPFHRYRVVRMLNSFLVRLSVLGLKWLLGLDRPILWFMLPHLPMLPGSVGSKCSVYYCIDDYASIPGVDRKAVADMDARMTERSDIVFIASDTLEESKKKLNANVYVSPHGVDFEHFNQVQLGVVSPAQDVNVLAPPIIGFFGLIGEWIDLELISWLARRHKDWQFVFIGLLDVESNPCGGLANVHFLGKRSYKDLPSYAACFTVAIMPYKAAHQQVINSNPLKLREYLSTGLPVVSVRLPQVEKYADVVAIADSREEFEQMLVRCVDGEESLKELAERRVSSVRAATWDATVDSAFALVREHCC